MRRVILCVLSGSLLASLTVFGGPANAGAREGYDSPRNVRVWSASSCCYRKVVRHVTTVRYVRVKRYSYRSRPRYYRWYWTYRPRSLVVRYALSYDDWRRAGVRYANYVPPPDCRLVRIANLDGTWIWARRAGCF